MADASRQGSFASRASRRVRHRGRSLDELGSVPDRLGESPLRPTPALAAHGYASRMTDALRHATGAERRELLAGHQRQLGNAAVQRLLFQRRRDARAMDGAGAGKAGEADRAVGVHEPVSVLQRWPFVSGPGAKPAPKTALESAEEVWTSLLGLSKRATPELVRVGASIRDYLAKYDRAYATFTARLAKAEKEKADRQKWADVMMGIVIGTGVGLAASRLYTAATLVREIAYEAAGEVAEAGIGATLGSAPAPDFKAPPELNNDKVARGYLDMLARAWEAVGVVQGAALAFSARRDALRDAELGNAPTGRGRSTSGADAKLAKQLERLSGAVTKAEAALQLFLTTADIPLLGRGQETIEQDLWIAWMGRSAANAGQTLRGDGAIGTRADQLELFGRVVPKGTPFNAESLAEHARAETARVAQIGKVGVVVVPPRFDRAAGREHLGVMHVRPDAYAAIGRTEPGAVARTPWGDESYQKIVVWDEAAYLRTGEVVMVITTKSTGLRVERRGKSLPVSKEERQTGFDLLGIREAEYQPEASEALWGMVWGAVDWYLKDVKPALQVVKTEDGVLVTEGDGTKLVLFAPRTSDEYVGAAERRARTGAPRVVAVELNRRPVQESRRDGIVITGQSGASYFEQEIREARRALGRGPVIGPQRLAPAGRAVALQRRTAPDAPSPVVQRDDRRAGGGHDVGAARFDRRDRVAVQIMIAVLRGRSSSPPDLQGLSVQLRPEHKEWIVQLWSAATGRSVVGASTLSVPERHEALASAMRGALPLADRYAREEPSSGRTMRVELRDALQATRTDLHAAGKPAAAGGSFGFGFVPKIVEMGREPALARKGSPLSDQPAELREVVYLSFPSRSTPKTPEQWFGDLTDRQRSALTALYNALSAKDLFRFARTIHGLDNGEPHFWGMEQEGNTVSLKVVGDTEGLNQRLGDPGTQRAIALDSPFMSMMHRGQKSFRERTSAPGLHISVGPGKYWDVHLDAHPPVPGQQKESEADLRTRFLMHGLQELFPNMPRAALVGLMKKVRIPPDIAKKIGNQLLPAVRFHPATNSPLWQTDNPALVDALEIESLERDDRQMTATVGISTRR